LFEAGARLPFVSYWKGTIEPGTTDAMVSQIDLLNSLASIVGSEERTNDGQDLSSVFLGTSNKGRTALVLEATTRTAFRKGDWVLIPPYNGPAINANVNIELGNNKSFQLYNLSSDIGQENNLAEQNPEKLQEMLEDFVAIRGEDFVNTEALELK
jgi:arylsulfatase A-like enzyme